MTSVCECVCVCCILMLHDKCLEILCILGSNRKAAHLNTVTKLNILYGENYTYDTLRFLLRRWRERVNMETSMRKCMRKFFSKDKSVNR